MILLISEDFCFPPELLRQGIQNPIDATVLYRKSTTGRHQNYPDFAGKNT
jgi:hypothetical protein